MNFFFSQYEVKKRKEQTPLIKLMIDVLQKNYNQADSYWASVEVKGSRPILKGRASNDYPMQHGDGVYVEYDLTTHQILKFPYTKYLKDRIKVDLDEYFQKWHSL